MKHGRTELLSLHPISSSLAYVQEIVKAEGAMTPKWDKDYYHHHIYKIHSLYEYFTPIISRL